MSWGLIISEMPGDVKHFAAYTSGGTSHAMFKRSPEGKYKTISLPPTYSLNSLKYTECLLLQREEEHLYWQNIQENV